KKNYWTPDLEGAKRLLAQAGYADGFEMEIDTLNLPFPFTPSAEFIASQLAQVKIRATIKLHEAAADRNLKFGGAHKHMHPTGVSREPSLNSELFGRYHSSGPRNSSKYADSELDKLIEQQAVMTRDPEGRKKLVLDIQRRIMDRSGMIMPNPYAARAVVWPN